MINRPATIEGNKNQYYLCTLRLIEVAAKTCNGDIFLGSFLKVELLLIVHGCFVCVVDH